AHGKTQAPIGGPASIGVLRKLHASSVLRRQKDVQTPGVGPPPELASMGRHRPPAHSLLNAPVPAVQALPTVLPVLGVSTQRPEPTSHLRDPQSASVKQMGMHPKSVSA